MKNNVGIVCLVAFLFSLIVLLSIWQYQRRTLTWKAVPIEIVSSEIAMFRERDMGRVWTATVKYTFDGVEYTKTMPDLPFNPTMIYVDPHNPTHAVGEQGATVRALFVPIILVVGTGLFGFVLLLMKFSPS